MSPSVTQRVRPTRLPKLNHVRVSLRSYIIPLSITHHFPPSLFRLSRTLPTNEKRKTWEWTGTQVGISCQSIQPWPTFSQSETATTNTRPIRRNHDWHPAYQNSHNHCPANQKNHDRHSAVNKSHNPRPTNHKPKTGKIGIRSIQSDQQPALTQTPDKIRQTLLSPAFPRPKSTCKLCAAFESSLKSAPPPFPVAAAEAVSVAPPPPPPTAVAPSPSASS